VTDAQLYLSVGIPTLAVIVSLLVNLAQQGATNRRIDDLRDSMNKRFDDLRDLLKSEVKRIEDRIAHLEHPIARPRTPARCTS
jgi:hypothetical protein